MNFNQIKNEYESIPLTSLSISRKEQILDAGFRISQTKEQNAYLYQEYLRLAALAKADVNRHSMFSSGASRLMGKAQACYDLSQGRFMVQGPKSW